VQRDLGRARPEGLGDDDNGAANIKTKAEIIKFLKDSFALGHRAAATLTTENMLQAPGNSKSTRPRLAEFGVSHAFHAPFTPATRDHKTWVVSAEHRAHLCYLEAFKEDKRKKQI
jgi:hypothetical protein